MKDLLCDEFQQAVGRCLVRHRSILDVVAKLQEANARVTRAAFKASTSCGCIRITAEKPEIPSDISLDDLKKYMDTHLEGSLCEDCREALETEVGSQLFYLAGLLNLMDLNLFDILIKEHKKMSALGIFNCS